MKRIISYLAGFNFEHEKKIISMPVINCFFHNSVVCDENLMAYVHVISRVFSYSFHFD